MDPHERTRELYETVGGAPQPPLPPLPGPGDLESLEQLGVVLGRTSRRLLTLAMRLTGFDAFLARLPGTAERFLRTHDSRTSGGLCGPIVCATLALNDDPRASSALARAATLVLAARGLYVDLVAGRLPVGAGDAAGELGQLPNLFGTCLVVERGRARVFKSASLEHLTVAARGRLFSLRTGPPGAEVTPGQLEEALRAVARDARSARPVTPAPGLLTCATQETQLESFRRLEQSRANRESLALLRQGFLTLCLDLEHCPASAEEAAALAQSRNCGNRWYHSSLQLVVFGNGKACVLCNFAAYLDGNAMVRAASELWRRAAEVSWGPEALQRRPALPPAVPLRWQLDHALVGRAHRELRWLLDPQQATFELPGLGRAAFRESGLAPVPAFVAALELAARRLTGRHVAIHQLLAMSRYRYQGLAQAGVTTPEVVRWVDFMEGAEPRRDQALALLREAMDSQLRECRKARARLALSTVWPWFLGGLGRVRRRYVQAIAALTFSGLRKLGLRRPAPRDVIISHPAIAPGVSIVGRPGVRMPQVRCFGLHYQMHEDKTVLTLMPATGWTVPNVQLVEELRAALTRVLGLSGAARGHAPERVEPEALCPPGSPLP